MKLTKEEMSELEKQSANKPDVVKLIESLIQFREEVVGNYNVLLSEINSQAEKNESAYSSLEDKIKGEILPQISELLKEQGKRRSELNKLNELMHSVKADMKKKEMKINELTAKNKALSSWLTKLTIFFIMAIAFLLCWYYL